MPGQRTFQRFLCGRNIRKTFLLHEKIRSASADLIIIYVKSNPLIARFIIHSALRLAPSASVRTLTIDVQTNGVAVTSSILCISITLNKG